MSATGSAAARSYWPGDGIAAMFDFAVRSHRHAAVFLVLLSLLAFLPGFFQIPPIDRDEAYFAQATKQMIETGDYVDIRYQDRARYRKPIGIYWLQAAAVKTAQALGLADARTTIWLYRMPSLLGAIGAVLATYWCALAFAGRRGAVLAALMMAASVSLGVEAREAKTDAVLLFAVVVAMGLMARAHLLPCDASMMRRARLDRPSAVLFWTALAAGILVKGPIIVMVAGLAAMMLSIIERSARWMMALRPLSGIAWLCLLVLPWFVAIYLRTGSAFLLDSVGQDMLAKIGGGQESHGAPPGSYLVLFFLTFFPGSLLAILAAPSVWSNRRDPAVRVLLAWLVPSWIVFELVLTKLPDYVLPLYPAVAILIAGAVERKALWQPRWLVGGLIMWSVIPLIVSVVVIITAMKIDHDFDLLAWPFFAVAIVCGVFAWRSYVDGGAERALLRAAATAILMAIGVYAVIVPSLAPAFPAVTLANILRASACKHPLAVSAGYEEPSLVFLAGTATQMVDEPGAAADFLRQGDCRFAFIEARDEPAFAARAEAIGLRYASGPRIGGFNISTSEWIDVAVFQSAGAP
jgi:4-amino-4-deoxy-L-arabinose transferase-like glycosyltransferase